LFNGPIECRLFEIPLTRGVYRPRANGELAANPITEQPQAGNSTED
jgi:putative N6-adenine-specific DNA methylase